MAKGRVKKTVKESASSKQENQPQVEEPEQFPLIDQAGTFFFQVSASLIFFSIFK